MQLTKKEKLLNLVTEALNDPEKHKVTNNQYYTGFHRFEVYFPSLISGFDLNVRGETNYDACLEVKISLADDIALLSGEYYDEQQLFKAISEPLLVVLSNQEEKVNKAFGEALK